MAPQTRHSKPYDEHDNILNVPNAHINFFYPGCDIYLGAVLVLKKVLK
jgi:hypothetical protein